MSIALFATPTRKGLRVMAATLCCSSLLAFAAVESYFWLGLPVSFQAKEYVFNPWPALELRKLQVQTTQPIEIPRISLKPDWSAWLTEFKTKRLRAETDEITATPSALARLGTSDGASSRAITRLVFQHLRLKVGTAVLNLPEGKMEFASDGTLVAVRIPMDKMQLTLSPNQGKLQVALQAERTIIPNLSAFVFNSVVAEGTIDEQGITLDKFGANGDGGSVSGTLRIALDEGANLSGNMTINSVNAKDMLDRIFPRHVVTGDLSGEFKLESKANSFENLPTAPITLEGTYTLKRGSIDHFGLLEGIRQANSGVVGAGLVRFDSISGKVSGGTGVKTTVTFTGLRNGALTGNGEFAVAPDGMLSGGVNGSLVLPDGRTLSNHFRLNGRASTPVMVR